MKPRTKAAAMPANVLENMRPTLIAGGVMTQALARAAPQDSMLV
jgi:hypothetical protein